MSTKELISLALALPPDDRALLANLLYDSLEETPLSQEEWDEAWSTEIEARAQRYERGETTARDWQAVLADVRQSLAERRQP